MARKRFWVTPKRAAAVDRAAAHLTGGNRSALLGQWIQNYIEHGLDADPDGNAPVEYVEITAVLDPQTLADAEERAQDEGIKLKDVIAFEIDALEEL
jgi:hypothetical protein